jgi:hypothetical protein
LRRHGIRLVQQMCDLPTAFIGCFAVDEGVVWVLSAGQFIPDFDATHQRSNSSHST